VRGRGRRTRERIEGKRREGRARGEREGKGKKSRGKEQGSPQWVIWTEVRAAGPGP